MKKTKERKITANHIEFQFVEQDKAIHKWDAKLFKKIIDELINLPLEKRLSRQYDWLFYLDHVEYSDDNEYLLGWFKSGRNIGILPPVLDAVSLKERDNPKRPTEGEMYKTHFAVRLSDGLFLFEKTGRGVVTLRRIENQIETLFKELLRNHGAHMICLSPLLSRDFIERIEEQFTVLKRVLIKVNTKNGYLGQNEAMSAMYNTIEPTYANYMAVEFGIRRAKGQRHNKLCLKEVLSLLRQQLADETHILSAKVWGKNRKGQNDYEDFHGVEEKYMREIALDENGLIVSDEILSFMMQIAKERDKLI